MYGNRTDDTAFLFSLTNPSGTPLKLMVTKPEYAVLHSSSHGPTFGGDMLFGRDLYVFNSSNTNRRSSMNLSSYEYPNGLSGREGGRFIVGGADGNFQTVEVEVYQCF